MGKLLSWNPDAYINWRLRNRGQRATFCLSILLPSPIKPLLCNMPTVDGEKRNQNEIIVSVKSSTVSKERLPMLDCDEYIQKPGIARASLAPSIERPQGSIGHAEQVGDYVRSWVQIKCLP